MKKSDVMTNLWKVINTTNESNLSAEFFEFEIKRLVDEVVGDIPIDSDLYQFAQYMCRGYLHYLNNKAIRKDSHDRNRI